MNDFAGSLPPDPWLFVTGVPVEAHGIGAA